MNIDRMIQAAFECHRNGNLTQAEYYYKKIINKQRKNRDVLYMLGVLYNQLGKYDLAIQYIRKALQFNPHFAEAYFNLGLALQGKGSPDEALEYYQKALEFNPSFAEAYCNLGLVYQRKGALDDAIGYYQKALELKPSFAEVYCNLGLVYQRKGALDDAIGYYQKALELNPSFADGYFYLALALEGKGRLDEVITYYKKTIELNPLCASAYCNLGAVLVGKEQFDEALIYCRKAIGLNKSLSEAYCNLGAALIEKEQFDEAIVNCQKAVALNPSMEVAYCNLGTAFKGKGNFDEAVSNYKKSIDFNPDFGDSHFNMSFLFLLSGDLEDGWREYEWRWKTKDFVKRSHSRHPSDFSQPIWDGSSLEGKTILVFAEQGVGDEIMFASCFEEIIRQSHRCFIECDSRLIPIFSRSFPEAVFIERAKENSASSPDLPQTDFVIPMGSLPGYLRTDLKAFPQKSYLVPDADKVHFWRSRLKGLGDGLKVGISWRGGKKPSIINQRSVKFEQWEKVLSLSGVHFINLQYGDCKAELAEVKDKLGITIHDWDDADPLKDLDNFASEIFALDLVISVDNSTVHMAGALGVPVWTLVPFVPDWRWIINRDDSPWYPAMRVFRQPALYDWQSVISLVRRELLNIAG